MILMILFIPSTDRRDDKFAQVASTVGSSVGAALVAVKKTEAAQGRAC